MNHLLYNLQLMLSSLFHTKWLLPHKLKPHIATLSLTENCQSRCITCNHWHTRKKDLITTERAKVLVDELVKLGFKYLRIYGGEPLLRNDLFEILNYIPKKAFSKIILCTNGLLLGAFSHKINESSVTNLTVSIDGVGEVNDLIRGVKGYYHSVLDNLEKINGKRIKIASIATKYLAANIEELLKLCEENGFDHDICLPSIKLPYAKTSKINHTILDIWPSEGETDRILKAMLQAGMITKTIARGARNYLVDKIHPSKHCIIGFTGIRIAANGDVYSCYEYDTIGNILHNKLGEILSSKRTYDTVTNMYDLKCSTCQVNWQASKVFSSPWRNIGYIYKRISTRTGIACSQPNKKAHDNEHHGLFL